MSKYKCIVCNLECSKLSNLKAHNNTIKHNKLVNIYYENLINNNNKIKEYDILINNYKELEDKYKIINDNYKKIEEDKNKLEKDKIKLEEDKNKLNEENLKLIQENIELKNKNIYLEKELKEKKDLNVLQSMKIGKLNKIIDNNKNLKINSLEKELKENKDLLVNNHKELINKIIDKEDKIKEKNKYSLSTLAYANKHFTDALPLSKINNFKINDYDCDNNEDKDKIIELIFTYYDDKVLHKLLGDHIIKFYKKENQKEQSFHTTDSSRLSYIVRQLLENINIWMNDKGGLIISEKVIEPLLQKCVELLLEFQQKLTIELSQSLNFTNIDTRIYKILEIINIIKTGELADEIHKYISSYFIVNRLLE